MVVNQRQWMSREKLLDLLGITNLIPGPLNRTRDSWLRTRWMASLLIAGSCWPAMLIVWGCCLCSLPNRSSTPMAAVWHQACDYCDRASGALEAGQKSC